MSGQEAPGIKTESIDYQHGDVLCKGQLAYDPAKQGKLPLVLVAHAWGGRDAFALDKAGQLAKLGYAGFALDTYGDATLGRDKEENTKLITPFLEDRKLLRARLNAGLKAAQAHGKVDAQRSAAIGFCFGGLCVLDMARGGEDLRGVVSFHGLLGAADNLPNAAIKAKVLALHGWDDPMGTPEQVLAFTKEMTAAKADWQLHAYGSTLHAFTNPQANDPDFGTVYEPKADRRSWVAMENFLKEVLK